MICSRYRVWAEIDISAIRHNASIIRRAVGPSVRMMAVVKANGYGHGALTAASAALGAGCSMLGVNDAAEALELRESGIRAPILLLGTVFEDEVEDVVAHGLSVTVHSAEILDRLEEEAARRNRLVPVHIKVDTGMTRLGVPLDRARDLALAVTARPHLALDGIFTHFSSAMSADAGVTREQLARFDAVLRQLERAELRPPIVHAANSAALFTASAARFDMVRPGIALYGLDPGLFARLGLDLRPALSLRTQVVQLRRAAAGTTVGYEETYRVARETVIATCPIGYEDGYPWQLSNRGTVLIRGRRASVVGRVSMNYITVDVGHIPGISVGDAVTLVGRDGANQIRVEDLARSIGTIPYEMTCRLGRRVRRVAVESQPAAAEERVAARAATGR